MDITKVRTFIGVACFIFLLGIQGGEELGRMDEATLLESFGVLAVVLVITFWPWVHRGLSRAVNGVNRFWEGPVVRLRVTAQNNKEASGPADIWKPGYPDLMD